MVIFGFFALVLVSVYWVNQAVRLFDRLIGGGQPAWVFAEFTALTLPNVIRLVLPMSSFAAAVYVTNRLSSESELVVMQSTGFSPWRLARPILYFGMVIGLMMSILTHLLVPQSLARLQLREAEVAQNVTAKFLTEGTFLHPSPGVTFYIREITPSGALEDVFLSDRTDPKRSITYSAAKAYLVSEDGRTNLIMVDGLTQTFIKDGKRLFTTHFSDLAYDVDSLLQKKATAPRNIRHISTLELLQDFDTIALEAKTPPGRVLEEAHGRINQAFLCAVAALIGFSTLLIGGFSRFGVWRQIIGALLLLVVIKLVEGLVSDPVRANPNLWFLVYMPSVVGAAISCALLAWSARERRSFHWPWVTT